MEVKFNTKSVVFLFLAIPVWVSKDYSSDALLTNTPDSTTDDSTARTATFPTEWNMTVMDPPPSPPDNGEVHVTAPLPPPPNIIVPETPPPNIAPDTQSPPNISAETTLPPTNIVGETPPSPPNIVVETPLPPPNIVSETPPPPPNIVAETPPPPPNIVAETPPPPPNIVAETPLPPPNIVSETPPSPPNIVAETPPSPPNIVSETPPSPPNIVAETPPSPPNIVSETPPSPPNIVAETPLPPPNIVAETPPSPPNIVAETPPSPPNIVSETPPSPLNIVSETPPSPPNIVAETPLPPPNIVAETPLPPPNIVAKTSPSSPNTTVSHTQAPSTIVSDTQSPPPSTSLPDTQPTSPSDGSVFVPAATPSPFDMARDAFTDFQSQIVAVHNELCGTFCRFEYQYTRRRPARACSKCFCDPLCHVYGDCCPDVQLLDTVPFPPPWEETKKLTQGRSDVYTCEISHLKPFELEDDEGNYFSMVNYCPRNITSQTSTVQNSTQVSTTKQGSQGTESEQHQSQWLEEQCENRANSSHWHYLRPWTSREGVVYRNQFCAQCHGHHPRHLTPWTTSVTCDADLLRSATSVKEAYFLAVSTPDCDIRFTSDLNESLRKCTSLQPPIISSCNETGLWRNYDDKVARACASFTAPVKRKYKNAFCYMCNEDLSYWAVWRKLDEIKAGGNIARVSFFALLNVDGDEGVSVTRRQGEENGAARSTEECDTGLIRDPLQCHCRPVKCSEGLQVKGNNCSEIFSRTNYFGFEVCTRFHIETRDPIPDTAIFRNVSQYMKKLRAPLSVKHTQAFPRLDCKDKTRGTIDVRVKVFSYDIFPLKQMADIFQQSLQEFGSLWSTDSTHNITVLAPAANCTSTANWLTAIPDSCPTKIDTMAMGMESEDFIVRDAFGEIKLNFATLYNTTFCPYVNLTEDEFRNYTEKLGLLNLTEANVTMDIVSTENSIMYLICVEDYLLVNKSTDTCSSRVTNPGKNESVTGFQDTWTPLGVISTVCTCVSLVCLLAVMVTYLTLSPLRTGSGQCSLAMACVLFVAQALHEVGLEQFEVPDLCLALALLIHFFWLSAVFMMTSCTLQLFLSIRFPLKAKMSLSSRKVLVVSLLSAFGLSAAIVGITVLSNHLVYGDLGYPVKYLCFIRRRLSRQLGFGLPLGLAVFLNILLFLLAILHLHRRPNIRCSRQDRVSLAACFRLSVVTGACWLSLFLLEIPGTRPWLEYAFVVLLGLQGFLLATTLLLNKRVFSLWKEHFNQRRKNKGTQKIRILTRSNTDDTRTNSPAQITVEASSNGNRPVFGKKTEGQCEE